MLEHKLRHGRWWDQHKTCHGKAGASLLLGAGLLYMVGRLSETKYRLTRLDAKSNYPQKKKNDERQIGLK